MAERTPGVAAGEEHVRDRFNSSMTGIGPEEQEYLIPTGQTVTVRDMVGRGDRDATGVIVELIERTGGGDVSILTIDSDAVPVARAAVGQSFVGDGDRRLVLKRSKTSVGTEFVAAFWTGVIV